MTGNSASALWCVNVQCGTEVPSGKKSEKVSTVAGNGKGYDIFDEFDEIVFYLNGALQECPTEKA